MAERPAVSGTRRIAFATGDARGFVSLRGALLAEATRRRHTVVCLAPDFDAGVRAALERIGVHATAVAFEAPGYNLFANYRIKRDLAAVLAAFAPHTLAVADLALMPVLVAAMLRKPIDHIVPMVADFASTLMSGHLDKARRKAFEAATTVIVETPDSARHAVASGMLRAGVPVVVQPASGIDLRQAMAVPMPPIGEGLTFLHVAASGEQAGRELYAKAAAEVKPRSALARFVEADTDDTSAVAAAHVIVHTGDQDGLSPGLLSGLAAGRPLITADVAGAREAVDERVNGCRFAPGDAGALAEAMLSFLRRPHELSAMARASRAKAERRFDVTVVNNATLAALGLGESYAAAA